MCSPSSHSQPSSRTPTERPGACGANREPVHIMPTLKAALSPVPGCLPTLSACSSGTHILTPALQLQCTCQVNQFNALRLAPSPPRRVYKLSSESLVPFTAVLAPGLFPALASPCLPVGGLPGHWISVGMCRNKPRPSPKFLMAQTQ